MYHAGQDIRGDVVPLHDSGRSGNPGGIPHMSNLAGVGMVSVHVSCELSARFSVAKFGGPTRPLFRPLLAPRDAAPHGLADNYRYVLGGHLTQETRN